MFKLTTSNLHHRITIAHLEPMSQVSKIEPRPDFQQCGILTNVDSQEPVQPLSLETLNAVWSVS